MKVLIVSDTHGREQNLAEALEQTGPIDQLIHLGDVEGGAEHIRELAGDAPQRSLPEIMISSVIFRMSGSLHLADTGFL